jgi:hypothetical protein
MLEGYLNRELVSDFAPILPYGRYDFKAINLCVMFPMISEMARQRHAMESMQMAEQGLAGMPSFTLNQILSARGEEGVKGGDVFWLKTATGAVPWVGYENELGDFAPISTGGSLGSQSPEGGPDSDEDDPSTDEEGDGPSPDVDGPTAPAPSSSPDSDSDTNKSLWYDARPPGMPWKPKYMRRSSPAAPMIVKKSADKTGVSKDEAKANKVLRKEAARIFEEAAKRGKRG